MKPFVAILMGSDSDLPAMEDAMAVLNRLGVNYEARIRSAHRTPAATHEYVREAEARGCAVFIAAAGMAAHLAGVVASLTVKPVIGVPMQGGALNGIDALLSTAQMPGGIPVACTAIGKAGAKNAAYLAAQILALQDLNLHQSLESERKAGVRDILAKDEALIAKLGA
ncbi:MAG: 5-(carboxyamino)imidazole ribonucleotide mutase [Gammaproteobacteria bacterium]